MFSRLLLSYQALVLFKFESIKKLASYRSGCNWLWFYLFVQIVSQITSYLLSLIELPYVEFEQVNWFLQLATVGLSNIHGITNCTMGIILINKILDDISELDLTTKCQEVAV